MEVTRFSRFERIDHELSKYLGRFGVKHNRKEAKVVRLDLRYDLLTKHILKITD